MRLQSALVFFGLAPLLVAADTTGSFKRPAGLIRRSPMIPAVPRSLRDPSLSYKKRQDDATTCGATETACGTGCCPEGNTCVNETAGSCCPADQPDCANTPTTCTDATYVACTDFNFCCPPGETCSVDATGEPQCGDGTASGTETTTETATETNTETGDDSTVASSSRTTTRATSTRASSSSTRVTSSSTATTTSASNNNGAQGLHVGGSVFVAAIAAVAAAVL